MQRFRAGVVAGLVVLSMVSAVVPGAASAADKSRGSVVLADGRSARPHSAKTPGRPVLKSSAAQVAEGGRYSLTARVRSPKRAVRAVLEKWEVPAYYGEPYWDPVKTVRVAGKGKVTFKRVATDLNNERYRVVLTYKKVRKAVSSRPVSVAVWRWIPLSEYSPYYQSESYAIGAGTAMIDGRAYRGWGPYSYSRSGAWESRFTPGRHCTSFRAVLGVTDISADGSTASIGLTADDTLVYTSPSLTPGMSVPVTVALAKPYRFGVRFTDTTPEDVAGRSWPVLGDPAFYCTGV